MSKRPSLTRSLKAFAAAGITPSSIVIKSDGTIEISTGPAQSAEDLHFRKLEARIAQGRQKVS